MHKLLNYDENLPAYVLVTDCKIVDNKGACDIPMPEGSAILVDQFYNDFFLLNIWDSNEICFVVRHKDNLHYRTIAAKELSVGRQEHIL